MSIHRYKMSFLWYFLEQILYNNFTFFIVAIHEGFLHVLNPTDCIPRKEIYSEKQIKPVISIEYIVKTYVLYSTLSQESYDNMHLRFYFTDQRIWFTLGENLAHFAFIIWQYSRFLIVKDTFDRRGFVGHNTRVRRPLGQISRHTHRSS